MLVQLLDRLQDAEAGPDGPFGVVLVCHGRAEDGHDRVADELLDRAAVALDLLPQASVVGADAGADVLGVSRFRGGGEADEVAEEHGDDLALLLHRRCRLRGERRAAEGAERELARELLTAGGTRRHARSLGRSIARFDRIACVRVRGRGCVRRADPARPVRSGQDARELFDGREASGDLLDAVVPHRPHPAFHRRPRDLVAARVPDGE